MKVLIIHGDPRLDGFGGVEEHTQNLLAYLSNNPTLQVNVLTFGHENRTFHAKKIKYNVLKRWTDSTLKYSFFLPLDLLRIIKRVNKEKPDLIHFQGTHPLYSMAAWILKRNYPTLITVHGILAIEMDYHTNRNYIFKKLSKLIERFSLRRLENIIVVAPQIEEIVKGMTNSRTFMVSNGIDLEKINSVPPLKEKLPPYIFFIGVLVERKGVNVLLDALIKIKKELPDFYMIIAGSGEEENSMKQFVKDNRLEKNVKFLGFVKGNPKYSYLKSAEVVILPSLWESLPISILEGMGCGKPIVASDIGGIPYQVKDGYNGFLVQPGNSEELAEKIIILLQDKKLKEEMGKNSALRAEQFDWNIITQQTIEVYQTITGREIK